MINEAKKVKNNLTLKQKIHESICTSISFNGRYFEAMDNIVNASSEIWSLTQIKRFTDHSLKHSERVLDIALRISSGLENGLNEREMFILVAACYLHDIGMQWGHYCEKSELDGEPLEEWDTIRQHHAERSVLMIKALLGDRKSLELMNGFRPTLAPIINFLDSIQLSSAALMNDLTAVVLSHTKDSQEKESGWNIVFQSQSHDQLRLDLLAALFRYSDELDMGRFRIYDFSMFDRNEIPSSSLEYWYGCALIDHVEIEVKGSLVIIKIHPDYNIIPKMSEHEDFACFLIYKQFKKLVRSLSKPFIPSLPCISEIFAKYGLAIRVNKLIYEKKGLLDSGSYGSENYLKYFEILYKKIRGNTISADSFSLKFYSFPAVPKSQICLVQESDGLRLPLALKNKIIKWVNTQDKFLIENMNIHTTFHRIENQSNFVEEFLPDEKIAPLSILGIAGATKANHYDLDNVMILPSKINCSSTILGERVRIKFPEFRRTSNWNIKSTRAVGPWDVIPIVYSPTGEIESRSIAFGLLTSLGETTFVTIPTDQVIPKDFYEDINDEIMAGAGISEFFYNYAGSKEISDPYEEEFSEEWKSSRMSLLVEISEKVKVECNIEGPLVCSILGYIEEDHSYKVITWRDNNIIIPDYLHVGVIASALFLVLDNGKDYLTNNLPFIRPEIFPKEKMARIKLWDNGGGEYLKVSSIENQIMVDIDIKEDYEHKILNLS